jgi:tripartite-type tricarboxylate transporter receptor subunit TctC
MFKTAAGLDIVHVPYKGTVQAVAALVAGQVDMVFADMVPALPQIKGGNLRPLAVTSAQRSAVLPDVPTMSEAGVPNFDSAVWWALLAPKGTPRAIVMRINGDLAKIMQMPDVLDKYTRLGISIDYGTPEAVTAKIVRQTPRMGQILKAAGVEPE